MKLRQCFHLWDLKNIKSIYDSTNFWWLGKEIFINQNSNFREQFVKFIKLKFCIHPLTDSNSSCHHLILSILPILPNLMYEKWFYRLNVYKCPPHSDIETPPPNIVVLIGSKD